MNITTKKLSSQDLDDLIKLIRLYEETFEMEDFIMPPDDHLKSLLENDHMIFYAAFSNELLVGGLTAHILPSTYFPSSEVYIYDLAVKTEYQRKGIGKKLLDSLKKYCSQLRMKEIFVQADLEDQHAIDFYRSTGGIPESVVHFSYGLAGNK